MGNRGGDEVGIGDIRSLVDRAKEELRKGEGQGRRNVFISFAHEDIDEVNLLRAHARNENSPIEFNDWSVSEAIDSERAAYIKQKIRERIVQSSLTVVYISDKAQSSPWVAWEVEESLKRGKRVIGVYAGKSAPRALPDVIRRNKIRCVSWSDLAKSIEDLE